VRIAATRLRVDAGATAMMTYADVGLGFVLTAVSSAFVRSESEKVSAGMEK
jgi:hypothetical protein